MLPGLAISALIVYDSEWEEIVGKISGVLCVGAIGEVASMHTADSGCKLGMIGVLGAFVSIWLSSMLGTFHERLRSAVSGRPSRGRWKGILPQSCADYWNDDHFEDRYVILLSRYMQQSCRQCCDVRT